MLSVAREPRPDTSEFAIAALTQLEPLYFRNCPEARLVTFSCAPPNDMLLAKVWRAVQLLATDVEALLLKVFQSTDER